MEDGDWLSDYEAVSARGQDLMNKVAERNRSARNSSSHVRQTTEITKLLKTFSRDIENLKTNLRRTSLSVTGRELQRRETLIDSLVTKEKHVEEALTSDSSNVRTGSAALFETGRRRQTSDHVVGWGADAAADDDDDTACLLTNDEVRQEQRRVIRDQDEGLDALSEILARQKTIGLTIGNEVETQNEILDDIHDNVETVRGRVVRETRNVERVDRKDRTWWLWLIMVLLLLAIVVIIAVPYHKSG